MTSLSRRTPRPPPKALNRWWPSCRTRSVIVPGQDIDQVPRAEALPGSRTRYERFARRQRAVPAWPPAPGRCRNCRRRAAPLRRNTPAAPAGGRAAVSQQPEQRVRAFAARGAYALRPPPSCAEQLAQRRHIAQAVEHPGIRRQAVAPGAAGLLVIGLDALRQIQVRDEAHVRLVDAHAEGDGGDDDHALLAQEALLVARARRGVQPGMVGQRVAALRRSARRPSLPSSARQAIDDAGVAAGALPAERPSNCCLRVLLRQRCGSGYWAGRNRRRRGARRPAPAAATISRRVGSSAVAVSAKRGTSGKRSCSTESLRYSARKSCPHCDTQCASSMAKSATALALEQVEHALRQQPLRARYRAGRAARRAGLRSTCAASPGGQGGVQRRRRAPRACAAR